MIKSTFKTLSAMILLGGLASASSALEYAYYVDEGTDEAKKIVIQTVTESDDEAVEFIIEESGAGDENVHSVRKEELHARINELRSRLDEGEAMERRIAIEEARSDVEQILREFEYEWNVEGQDEIAPLVELAIARQAMDDRAHYDENVLIPMVAIIATFSMPVLIIALVSFFRYRKRRLSTEAFAKIVAAQPEIDSERLAEIKQMLNFDGKVVPNKASQANRDLRRGAILTAVGGAITLGMIFSGSWDTLWLSLIMLCVGLAFLWLNKISPNSIESE